MNDPSLQLYMVVVVLAAVVRADNFTEKYMTMGASNKFQTRQHRFLSFNTDTEGEISIEMQFSVPFIKIPVEKAVDMTKGAIANFNVASLIVTGAIVVVTGFILPTILKIVDQKVMPIPINTFGRDSKAAETEWWRILTLMDQALIENNVDTTSCMQRAVCWAVHTSLTNISTGKATSRDKIIDGLITNEWLHKIIQGSAIDSAIRNGIDGVNCSVQYSTCRINEQGIAALIEQFTKAINVT